MAATNETGRLAGKVAIVTGASKGIGAGIALELGAAGASVVVNYSSSREGAEKVVKQITDAGGRAVAVGADLSKPDQVPQLFAGATKAFGDKLDVLVNNAGVYTMSPLEAVTPDDFHRMFNLNVLGLLLTTQEALKHFGPEGGSVINISSIVSSIGFPGSVVYNATKGAVDTITWTLSKELGPKQIRVNSINPGAVFTEGSADLFNGPMVEVYKRMAPLGRLGMPDDIAPAAVFLASDESKWLTGQTIMISGGVR